MKMTNTIIHSSTCTTCKRILKEFETKNPIFIDIKKNPLDENQLKDISEKVGSNKILFNKRAKKVKDLELEEDNMNDNDYKNILLLDYTFIKRPIFIFEDKIFIGNDKKTLGELEEYLK